MAEEREPELTISHSQLGVWNKCRFAYHLNYVQGWTKKEKAIYFRRGNEIHDIAAKYYNTFPGGLGNLNAVKAWVQDALARNVEYEMIDHIQWLMQRYILDYSAYEDRDLKVLEVEKEFTIEYETPKGRLVRIHGFVDLVKEVAGKLWLVDHKTAGNAKFWTENEIQMDSQLPTYMGLLNRHGYDIFGCELNFLNTYEYKKRDEVSPDKLFKRARTYRTEIEVDNILLEFGKACDDIIDNRENVRRSLSKDCSRCQFFDPCHLSLKGMNIEELLPAAFKIKGQDDKEEFIAPEADQVSDFGF